MSQGAADPGPRIVLGTAQFGSAYGVTNAVGRVSDRALAEILDTALARGISALDTSIDYGDAEARIAPWAPRFTVVTKCKARDPRGVAGCLAASMAALGTDRLDGVLVHDWHALSSEERIACAEALQAARDAGIAASLGVSVYLADEVAAAIACFDRLDIVQVPSSALDQRLHGAPVLAEVRARGGRVQVRSVLLQGLLGAPGASAHADVRRFFEACAAAGLPPVVAALAWVRALPWADEVVLGVTSASELTELLDAWSQASTVPPSFYADLASTDLSLIDPRLWG